MAKKDTETAEGDEKKGPLGGKLKLVAMILPAVLVAGGLAFFFLAPSGEEAPAKGSKSSSSAKKASSSSHGEDDEEDADATEYVEGKLLTLDPVTINLAGGHYLKVGIAIQATADAGEHVEGSKALDALIAEFSGRTVDDLATKEGREESKKALVKELKKIYHDKVYEMYWTTFVMN